MDLSIINPLGCLSLTMSEHKLLLPRLIEQKQQFSERFNTQACLLTPGKYCQFLISVTLINIPNPNDRWTRYNVQRNKHVQLPH